MIRIVIADDQALVRAGFRLILDSQPDFTVVAEAGDGEEAISAWRKYRPDIILMDVRMPKMDGLTAAIRIGEDPNTATRVVMLTTFDLDEYVYAALRGGSCGFLLKDLTPEYLIAAVRQVVRGDALLAPSITRRLIERFAARPSHPSKPEQSQLKTLSAREMDVLRLVATGLNNAEIAASLHVSQSTVKTHLARLLSKLNLRDRVQAVVAAYELGVVHFSPSVVNQQTDSNRTAEGN